MELLIGGSGSSGNSYILKAENEYLILDAGVSLKAMMPLIDFQISKISGVLVTHVHKDHDQYSEDWQKRGIKVLKPFDETHKNTTLKRNSQFKIKPFALTNSEGQWVHTNSDGSECPIYGYYITHPEMGILVYTTDCEFIKYRFKGVNHYLIEANYDLDTLDNDGDLKAHRVFGSHQSIQAACKFVGVNQSAELRNVILCHLSSQNGSPEQFKEVMQEVVGDTVNVSIARKGLEIEL